jgi:hypothetical protein
MVDGHDEMSLLEHLPNNPNIDLPPKSMDAIASDTLINMFLAGDISDNGNSV